MTKNGPNQTLGQLPDLGSILLSTPLGKRPSRLPIQLAPCVQMKNLVSVLRTFYIYSTYKRFLKLWLFAVCIRKNFFFPLSIIL